MVNVGKYTTQTWILWDLNNNLKQDEPYIGIYLPPNNSRHQDDITSFCRESQAYQSPSFATGLYRVRVGRSKSYKTLSKWSVHPCDIPTDSTVWEKNEILMMVYSITILIWFYWLVHRDPCDGLLQSLDSWSGSISSPTKPNQPGEKNHHCWSPLSFPTALLWLPRDPCSQGSRPTSTV